MLANSTLHLGQLELAVLDYLWLHKKCDVKSLHVAIVKARAVSANIIQSTLERLFKKNLLSRTKMGHAYHHKSVVNRTQLIARSLDDLTSEIAHGQTNSVLAAFVEFTARIDESSLEQLEQLIAQHKNMEDSK